MDALANWMQGSWVFALLVAHEDWSWPTLESLHFIGMSMLFGALIVMDLRLLGWEKAAAVVHTDRLYSIALAGFAINLITGITFCFGDPHRYFENVSFHVKMLLIILAALNFLYYKFKVERLVVALGPGEDPPAVAKFVAATSLLLWLGVLTFGRLIPYLGTSG